MGDKTKEIEGVNLLGEKRKYTFQLMNPKNGLIIFHEFAGACMIAAPLLTKAVPMVVKFMDKTEKAAAAGKDTVELKISDLGPEILQLLEFIPTVVTPFRLDMLCRYMLAGMVVDYEVDGKGFKETVGDDGVGEYTAGDPLEVYVSLFYAVQANYPKLLGPLSQLASVTMNMLAADSIPDSDTTKTENPHLPEDYKKTLEEIEKGE